MAGELAGRPWQYDELQSLAGDRAIPHGSLAGSYKVLSDQSDNAGAAAGGGAVRISRARLNEPGHRHTLSLRSIRANGGAGASCRQLPNLTALNHSEETALDCEHSFRLRRIEPRPSACVHLDSRLCVPGGPSPSIITHTIRRGRRRGDALP